MNYKVKAFRVFSIKEETHLEEYEKQAGNFTEAEKIRKILKAKGDYTNIRIIKVK